VTPDDLETLVEHHLRRLPAPRAPGTLLRGVMAAVAEASRPWYARAWRTWPAGWQIASALGCLVFLAATAASLPVVHGWIAAHTPMVLLDSAARVDGAWGRVASAWHAAVVVWRVVVEPVALVALIPVLMMCAASVAFGAALRRLALGGTSHV
jgi:hypothetical protein